MNRAEESSLAWALADSATAFLRPQARAWLYAKIGAGEQESAIKDLLIGFVRNDAELPAELAALVWAWMRGYLGSDREDGLRALVGRIRVAERPVPVAESFEVVRRRRIRLAATRTRAADEIRVGSANRRVAHHESGRATQVVGMLRRINDRT